MTKFIKESVIRASCEKVFAFHELPDARDRLLSPWENAKVIQAADISKIGSRAIIETKIFGIFPITWVVEHTAFDAPRMFEEVQISGPFRTWRHRHIIEPSSQGSLLTDEIVYEMPLQFFGPLAAPIAMRPKLSEIFDYRHEITRKWCEE
ncbi:MAG: SRPBCC family protein [Pyrinomonadaceae bacterium]